MFPPELCRHPKTSHPECTVKDVFFLIDVKKTLSPKFAEDDNENAAVASMGELLHFTFRRCS
jgi:hypothetical protein